MIYFIGAVFITTLVLAGLMYVQSRVSNEIFKLD